MKHLYSISQAQLIVLWIFGTIATLLSMEKASYAPYGSGITIAEFLTWFLPLALFFYTIGWYERKKKK